MAYLLWRVATGRNLTIEMNSLIARHTKIPVDLHFGYLKEKTRKTKMSCLEHITEVSTIIVKQYLVFVKLEVFYLYTHLPNSNSHEFYLEKLCCCITTLNNVLGQRNIGIIIIIIVGVTGEIHCCINYTFLFLF